MGGGKGGREVQLIFAVGIDTCHPKLERVAAPEVESHEVVEGNVEDAHNGFVADSHSGISHTLTGLSCEVINVELYNIFITFSQ